MAPNFDTGSWPGVIYSNNANPSAADIRAMCTGCHDDTNASSPNGIPTIRGVEPSVAPATVSDHITYTGGTTAACTQCHNPHNPPAGGSNCLDCHRTDGPVTVKHQQADLEFPADGTWNAGAGEDNPSVQVSGHTGVIYSAVDNYATKATNECKKCHGTSHPSGTAKVVEADRANSYATGFVYGLSFSGSAWSANPASFADADGNGVIDGNDFCMSCHDGADALDPPGKSNIRIGGVDPPLVWFPDGGGDSTGHDRKSGTNYPVSGNPSAQQLCASCHKYHTSDRQKLLPGNTGPYGAGSAYTYAMPSWAGTGTVWQAPRPASSSFPSDAGRMVIGNQNANAINYTDRSSPASGKGFGTAGSTKTTYGGEHEDDLRRPVRRLSPGRRDGPVDLGEGAHARGGQHGVREQEPLRQGLPRVPHAAWKREHLHGPGEHLRSPDRHLVCDHVPGQYPVRPLGDGERAVQCLSR